MNKYLNPTNIYLNSEKKSEIFQYVKNKYCVEYFKIIDSTSIYLKNKLENSNFNYLICAEQQTSGKGRTGKCFFSPVGGLYFSFSINNNEINDISLLTIKVAIIIVDILKELYDVECQIKWVNDIYFNDLKVGGILCEKINDSIIIGIGLNMNIKDFPSSLNNIATTLNISKYDKELLVNMIVYDVCNKTFYSNDLIKKYKEKCILLNKDISFVINGIYYEGKAIDINKQGNLIVQTKNKKMILKSGEVSLGSKLL